MELNHRRSRSRKGVQQGGTSISLTSTGLRSRKVEGHVGWSVCVRRRNFAVISNSATCCTTSIPELLTASFYKLRKKAALGVDGVSWHEYEKGLEDRIDDLHGRIHRGAFRAKPWSDNGKGTPQGAILLANIFLHYVFDLWVIQWRKRHAQGDMIIVRYADDFVIGFEHEADARACLEALQQRMGDFGLNLHPKKTRLIEFGRGSETHDPHAGSD